MNLQDRNHGRDIKLYLSELGTITLLLPVVISTLIACTQNLSPSHDFEEEWLHSLTSPEFNGRKTGTDECKSVAYYIENELIEMGYHPQIEEFEYRDSITMRNIILEVPGDNDSILIIGAHYDGAVSSHIHQAANDNASGVVALLSLANTIKTYRNKNTIILCFWDGEENTDGTAFNGSTYFLDHYTNLNLIKSYCNIDCCGRKNDPIYLYYSLELENYFNNITIHNRSNVKIIRKIQEGASSDYVSFKNIGIPFWGWNDMDVFRYIHLPEDSKNHISTNKIRMVVGLTHDILSNI